MSCPGEGEGKLSHLEGRQPPGGSAPELTLHTPGMTHQEPGL